MDHLTLAKTIFVALALFCTTPSMAQDEDTRIDDARAIVVASKYSETLDLLFGNLAPAMESAFIGQLTSSTVGKSLLAKVEAKYPGGQTAFGKRFGELMLQDMRAKYPQFIDEAAKLYAAEFTTEELATFRTFLESPVGRRMTEAMPKIQQKLSTVGQSVGADVGAQVAEKLLNEAELYVGAIE